MANTKNQQQPEKSQQMKQITPQTIMKSKADIMSETVKDSSSKVNKPAGSIDNISTKKLSLVLYEVAKQQSQLFNDDQKFPVMASFIGVFVGLFSATFLNIAQILIKPQPKKKKWFFAFGALNFVGAGLLGGYGVYHMMRLYEKIPQEKWIQIQQEKEDYNKLSFSQKKKIMMQKIQQDDKKKLVQIIQSQRKKKQQNLDLTK